MANPIEILAEAIKELARRVRRLETMPYGNASGTVPGVDAEYVVMSLDATLTKERVLTAGAGITVTDNGANNTVVVASTITQFTPVEGPDIDLVGNQIGRGGDTILLFDSGGAPIAEYAATGAGLVSALAAATSGDVVELPPQTITVVNPTFNLGTTGTTAYLIKAGVKLRGYGQYHSILNVSHTAGEVNPVLIELANNKSEIENIGIDVAFSGTTFAEVISGHGVTRNLRIISSIDNASAFSGIDIGFTALYKDQVFMENIDVKFTGVSGCASFGVLVSTFTATYGTVRNVNVSGTYVSTGFGVVTGYIDCENIHVNTVSDSGCAGITNISSGAILRDCIASVNSSYFGSDGAIYIYGIESYASIYNCIGSAISEHAVVAADPKNTVGIYSHVIAYGCFGQAYNVSGHATGIYIENGYVYNSAGLSDGAPSYDIYDAGSNGLCSVGGTITHAAYDTQYYLKGDREKRGIRDNTPLTAGTYTLDYTYEVVECDASGGAIILNLPAIATYKGQLYYITKRDSSANTVTITPNGAETINGQPTLVLGSQYDAAQVYAGSTEWMVL